MLAAGQKEQLFCHKNQKSTNCRWTNRRQFAIIVTLKKYVTKFYAAGGAERKEAMQMACIEITMLGEFTIRVDGKPVLESLKASRKGLQMMQYLLLNAGRQIPHKELIDSVWGAEAGTNPDMALRAILHRVRNMMEAEGLECMEDCIVTGRGSYHWNDALGCRVDYLELTGLLERLPYAVGEEEMDLLRRVVRVYQGRLLPDTATETWAQRRAVELHSQYKNCVFRLLEFCRDRGAYEEIVETCRLVLRLEPSDDRLCVAMLLALQKLGRTEDAAKLHAYCRDRGGLPRHTPVDDQMFEQLCKVDQQTETDFRAVCEELSNDHGPDGAMLCTYPVLRGIYQERCRIEARYGTSSLLVMVTLVAPCREVERGTAAAMALLERMLVKTLRRCDVVCRYSGNQFLVLLTSVGVMNGDIPMERLKEAFYREPEHGDFLLNCRLYVPVVERFIGSRCRDTDK